VQEVGKDCSGCKKDIYSFSGTHDLLNFATQEAIGAAPKLAPKPEPVKVNQPVVIKPDSD